MGEAFISRAGNAQNEIIGNAVIRATTFSGATVVCTNGAKSQTVTSGGSVEFTVGYGTWTVTSTYNGKARSKTVIVSAMQIYEINLKGVTYGIAIDMSVSDPTSACSYIDDAVGMSPLSCSSNGVCTYNGWDEIIDEVFGVKPCLYNNGAVSAYLNKNNYALKADGSSADITSGSSGDVMIEFKKTWYKYSVSGSILKFEVSDYDRSADGFVTAAFLSEDGKASTVDHFYYGAYEGYVLSNKLRSLSGKTATANISYDTSIADAANLGSKYTIETFFKRMYILGLLKLVTRSRDSQVTIGPGRVNGNNSPINTGTMNTAGLFYGRPGTYTEGCKVFGIENFWGNYYNWMAGLVTMGSGVVGVKSAKPYSSGGSGYTSVSPGFPANNSLIPTAYNPYMNGAVILPTSGQSDTSIGWPDYFCIDSDAGYVALVGGSWTTAWLPRVRSVAMSLFVFVHVHVLLRAPRRFIRSSVEGVPRGRRPASPWTPLQKRW